MKQAVLYLTNKSNEWTLSAFHALEQSLQGMADVYFAYHQQGDVLPVSLQNIENMCISNFNHIRMILFLHFLILSV